MNNKTARIFKGIQIVLWIALAVSFLCMVTLEGKWQGKMLIFFAMALGNLYAYKKDPTQKKLKDISIALGSIFIIFTISTLFNL